MASLSLRLVIMSKNKRSKNTETLRASTLVTTTLCDKNLFKQNLFKYGLHLEMLNKIVVCRCMKIFAFD